MVLRPAANPLGLLQDDLRFLERWVWLGGLPACFLTVATCAMAAISLGNRNLADYNNLILALQYLINAVAFASHGTLLTLAAEKLAGARNTGGSVTSAFRMLRWAIIVDGLALLIVAVLFLFPTQLV